VPLEIAGLARQISAALTALRPICNPLLASDVTSGAALADAALRAALANVEANLPLLPDSLRNDFAAQVAALRGDL
jgi:formiminotetrahydrofolate cyclodeaminase